MAYANVIEPIPLASFDTSTLTGSYQAIDASGFDSPCVIVKMYNGGSVAVTVSWDGTNDHDYMPSGSTLILDITSNSQRANQKFVAESGQKIYLKGSAGTGSFYLAAWRVKE